MKNDKRGPAILAFVAAVAGGALAALVASQRSARIIANAPRTVPQVDLGRYLGLWYEIARYPNSFQPDDCVATTATYTQRDSGDIEVVNACRRGGSDGKVMIARGTARVDDSLSNAKLKVTFQWPFAGDYWIIDLGEQYDYAVVSEPQRRYLWILSRTPEMAPELYTAILERLRGQGFDTRKLIRRTK